MHSGHEAPFTEKREEEQHQSRSDGWCFCARCNEAREDLRRYDDGPDFTDAYEREDLGGEE